MILVFLIRKNYTSRTQALPDHIGNYLGAIKRMVEYQDSSDLFLAVVNLKNLINFIISNNCC